MLHNPQKFNLSNLAETKGECGSLLLFSPLFLGMWPAFPEVFPTTRIHLLQVKSSYLWMQYVDFKRLKWWWSPQLIRQYISRQPFTPFAYVQGIRIGPTFGPKWCQSICWDALHPPSSGKMKGQYNRAFSPKMIHDLGGGLVGRASQVFPAMFGLPGHPWNSTWKSNQYSVVYLHGNRRVLPQSQLPQQIRT